MKKLEFVLAVLIFSASIICSQNLYKNEIMPIDKSQFTKGLPGDEISLRWGKLLNIKCKEVLNEWWLNYETYENTNELIDFGYLENNSKTGEYGPETKGGIRPAAQAAYSLAAAIFTKAYEPDEIEVDIETALDRALLIVNSLAEDHLANRGINHSWGNQWQSAQWASKTAAAGWLLWEYLTSEEKNNIKNMIEYEANRFLNKKPASANENYINDTHAEENGWDATGIQTACALMPNHKNYNAWLNKSVEFRLNALARQADLYSSEKVDGRTVKECITGYNINNIGAAGNHGAYPHPDYMAAPLRHTIEGALFFKLGGQNVPEANTFNCNIVYKNFVDYIWNNKSKIYLEDGSVYWPINIETDRRFEFITFGIIDLGSHVLGYDNSASINGEYWEDKHTEKALEMELVGFISASAYLLRWFEFQKN